jgi:hypothetical protein
MVHVYDVMMYDTLAIIIIVYGQTDSVKKYRIRLSIINPSSVWLRTALDGQTYSVKKYRIRLSVVFPSAVAGRSGFGDISD